MDNNLIGLVNRIQRACTALGDYGGEGAVASLWESLPSVAVVGGQVCAALLPYSMRIVPSSSMITLPGISGALFDFYKLFI